MTTIQQDIDQLDLMQVGECLTLSLSEAAKVLGIHRSTAWELYRRGDFPVPVIKLGKRLRVAKVHLARLLYGDNPPGES